MRLTAWRQHAQIWAAALLISTAVVALPAAPAAAAPVQQPTCPQGAPTAAAATAAARACGHRVESSAERTEHTQVFANADGSFTSEQSLRPRFARTAGGAWVTADATLRRNADGTVSPVAPIFPIALSAGGAATPLVSLSNGGGKLELTWPGTLPAPVLSGSTATYPEVLPGVDLEVTATVDGFSHVLVVKNRAAATNPAVRQARYGLRTSGVNVAAAGNGSITATDTGGKALFAASSPLMWDSRTALGTKLSTGRTVDVEPADRRTARVGTAIAGNELTLRSDTAMLDDAATVYPVRIDPAWTGWKSGNAWTSFWSKYPSDSFWQNNTALNNASTKGGAGAGRTEDCSGCSQYIIRSAFRMDSAAVNGKHILGAKFTIEQRHAWTCSPASNARLWVTDGISSANTWNNQPNWWDSNWQSETLGNKRDGGGAGCSGAGNIEFPITNIVTQAAAGGWPNLTLGLRAIDEGTTNHWKRFNADSPFLSIDYNTFPTLGAASTSPASSCVSGSPTTAPLVAAAPALRIVGNDVDAGENDLRGTFEWQKVTAMNSDGTVGWGSTVSATDPIARSSGSTFEVASGWTSGIYRWHAKVGDPWSYGSSSGTDETGWSSWCEVQVDLTPPPLPTVTSPQYPQGCTTTCAGAGTTGVFTFTSAPDAAGYWWGLSDPPSTWVAAATPGAAVTVSWTPPTAGPRTLYVQAQDVAGNRGPIRTDYQFTVQGGAAAQARWLLDESGGTTLADTTGHGHPLTLTGGQLGQAGRIVNGPTALVLAGTGGAASSGAAFSTAQSYTVSAWVRLDNKSADRSVLDQRGVNTSLFDLRYAQASDRWTVRFAQTDVASPTYVTATSTTAPRAGAWTHLAVVYDAGTRQARLYVDGRAEGTAATVASWSATGNFRLGTAFHGGLADVSAWQRTLADTELRALIDPLDTGKVGEWHFSDVDSPVTLDSSNANNLLYLYGGASIPASGAGYDGTGLLLMDGTGHAETEGPVLNTDQSFTVSAWARLGDGNPGTPAADMPTGNRAVISQVGTRATSFWLGYQNYDGNPRWGFTFRNADSDTANWTTLTTGQLTTADIGRWTHLAGTYDATTGVMSLYVNGALAVTTVLLTPWNAAGPLYVGGALWAPPGGAAVLGDPWIGAIDEARAYAGVVPQAAGDWRFGSCTGTPVVCADGAIGNHPLTLASGATWSTSGHADSSGLALNGTGQAQTAVAVAATEASFTVSAWVKLTGTGADQIAVSQDGTRVSAFELGFRAASGGSWCFSRRTADADAAGTVSACAAAAGAAGTWVHVAGTYDATRGQLVLYVNGTEVTRVAYTGAAWSSAGPFVVGRARAAAAPTARLTGTVDDVRLFQGVPADASVLM